MGLQEITREREREGEPAVKGSDRRSARLSGGQQDIRWVSRQPFPPDRSSGEPIYVLYYYYFFLYLPGNSSVFQKSTAGQPSVRVLGQVRVQIRHKFERLVHARESRVRISGSTSSVGVGINSSLVSVQEMNSV
ncbi:hypothetical protein HanPSC8_Chr12g0503311 [Helianthus annuus]|nr:hypothetical protein HanPSC8_Chr12g0503311 [Helianthus annuus]